MAASYRSLAQEPRNFASHMPSWEAGLSSHSAWAHSLGTGSRSRKPSVQICESSSRGGGGEPTEGKAGVAAHWLEFGAVSAVPSSLWVWEGEGGSLGSLRGCRHSNQTERAGPLLHSPTSGWGNNPESPYFGLVSEMSYLIRVSELEKTKGSGRTPERLQRSRISRSFPQIHKQSTFQFLHTGRTGLREPVV